MLKLEKRIVCLAGDGVGPEVVESAKEVLHMVERLYGHHFHLQDEYFGGSAIDLNGQPLPQRTLAACLASDAVLLEQLVDQGGIVRKKDQRKDY